MDSAPAPIFLCTLAGLAVSAALAVPSHAAPNRERLSTASFAIARDPSGQKAAAAVGAVLRRRIQADERLRLIEPGRALSGDPRTREEEMVDRARAALSDGRRAYDALGLDDAIARLGQAVSLYQQAGPLLGDLGEFKTALAYLGAALTLRGSADEGVSTFFELLTLDPSYAPAGFPPVVNQVFDRALDRLSSGATGSAEIYSTPPYSAVFLDGEFRGVTPVTIDQLTAGTHYLRLEKDGYVVFGGPIDVAPKQRITSQTRLRDIKRGAELRDLLSRTVGEVPGKGMGGHLRSLARLLIAETLIVVAVSQSGPDASLTASVFDGTAAMRLGTERAVLSVQSAEFQSQIDAMVGRLLATATGGEFAKAVPGEAPTGTGGAFGLEPGAGTGNAGSGPSEPTASAPPQAQATDVVTTSQQVEDGGMRAGSIVGWTLVGLGAASVITGAVFGGLALQAEGAFKKTPMNSSELTSVQDDGRLKALVADLCIFGGLGIAAGGGLAHLITELDRPTPTELLGGSVVPTEGGVLFTLQGALP